MKSSDADSLEALRESEARLRRAELVSLTGNWEIHLETQMVYCSDGAREIYGLTGNIHKFSVIKEMYLPAYRRVLETARQNLIEKNIPYDVEFKIKTLDKGIIKDIHSLAFFDSKRRILFGVIQDITESNRAKESLRIAMEHLKFHRNNTPLGVVEFNDKFEIIEWSGKAPEIFGWNAEEMVGKNFNDFRWVHEEDKEKAFELSTKLLSGKISGATLENYFYRKDGSIIVCICYNSALFDSHGKMLSVHSLVQDITETRKIEERLKANYSLLRIAGKTAKFGGWSVDMHKNELHWSDQVAAIHEMPAGYSPAVIEGINFYAPEWREKILKVFTECTTKGKPYLEVMQIITSTGKKVWVRTTGEAVKDEKGNIVRVMGSFQDIDDIKMAEDNLIESEAKFRNLFEQAADAIIITEIESEIIIEANLAATRLLNLPHNKIIGLHQSELHQPGHKNIFLQQVRETASVNVTSPSETILIRSDGISVPVESMAVRVMIDGKECLRSTFRDITLRKQEELKLIELNNQLRDLNATKDKLFSIIAHDLINPFNSILGFSDLLQDSLRDNNTTKSETFVKVINSSAKSTLELLGNLLLWSKTQRGKVEFKPENISIKAITKEVIDVAFSSASIKNITLNCTLQDDIIVFADRNMLTTIIRNLVSNAIKFTHSGGSVGIEFCAKTDHVEIVVSDNGVGMDKEKLDKLFSFESGSTTNGTANEKGSGLGLIICKEFVERHNGSINIESKPGNGSRFIISLPVPPVPDSLSIIKNEQHESTSTS